MLRLCTLGGCFIERDGARLESASANRKGLALLALIATAGDRGLARDTVVALLWPESNDERARTSLRQLLHSLRGQLDAPELLLPTPELRLNPAVMESDVAHFRSALGSHDYASAVALHRGPFLDGFFLKGSDEFERWVSNERSALAQDAARALENLAAEAGRRGDRAAAIAHWRKLTQAEPHSARAATGLMRALEAGGERAAALQHARVYELMMREEFGDVPDSSVAELADALRVAPPAPPTPRSVPTNAGDPPAAVPAVTVPPQRRHVMRYLIGAAVLLAIAFGIARLVGGGGSASTSAIAVLPLANVSGNPDDEVIADGLTENLIASLARVSDLRVIARTSSFAFKTRTIDLRKIADSLDVGTIVEGSVQRAGASLKVNVQLVNAADATVLWSSTYNRELKDILVVQDEITDAIVSALSARLRAGATDHRQAQVVKDPEAYEMYLRGRHIFTVGTDRQSTAHAQRYFEQALQRDPAMAHAHAGLSDVYTRLGVFGFAPAAQAFAAAKAAAARAVDLNPNLGEAYASLAHLKCVAEYDWNGAVRDFERAVTLAPNYTFARMPYAVCLASMRRFRDAERQLELARSFDPLSAAVPNMLGRVHVYMQQPDEALKYLQQAVELSPSMDLAYQQMGHAYLQKGMNAEALSAFQRAADMSGARDSLHLAYAYARTGDRTSALRILNGISQSPDRLPALAFHLALAYTGLRDSDHAFHWLDRGLRDRASFMVGLAVETAFAPLHNDPRWTQLMRQMDLHAVAPGN